jgi:Fe-S oxidoreductase
LKKHLVVQGHCHQKAIISMDAEKRLFEAMGAEADVLDDGCCGMAGSFGFEKDKYDLSMTVYEHQLGPHLRTLPSGRVILADGFSCKTQIEHATGRRPLHLAQLLNRARRGGSFDDRIEEFGATSSDMSALVTTSALFVGGAAVALGAFYLGRRLLR